MIITRASCDYEVVIGLEVHAQIKTNTKLFSSAANKFTNKQNTNVSLVDIAIPGTLPVVNMKAIELTALTGFAINATVNKYSRFDRKNYFYPDLPSGYQITQFYHPLVTEGYIDITIDAASDEVECNGEGNGESDGNGNKAAASSVVKRINVERIHIEQDAGKLIHDVLPKESCVDFNRAGVPLMEVVSAPDMRSPQEAVAYLKKLRNIMRAIKSSDADMEKGSFRCDANVSVRPVGSKTLGTRCEIKNLNSFKFIAKAIEFEANHQADLIEAGEQVVQQTKLFNPTTGKTASMRTKEEAADYRYFPDPDLLAIKLSPQQLEEIKAKLPELPEQTKKRYLDDGMSEKYADLIVSDSKYIDYYDAMRKTHERQLVCTWLCDELLSRINKSSQDGDAGAVEIPSSQHMIELLTLIVDGEINGKIAKEVLDAMMKDGASPAEIVEKKGLKQIENPDEIRAIIEDIIQKNPSQTAQYKDGKTNLFGFFVGQTMKATQGKANPKVVNDILSELLQS